MGNQFAAAVGASAFWIFVAAAAVTSILAQYLKYRETQKTIRQAIEKGQADPEAISRLMAANNPVPPNRRGLIFLGTLFVCLGLGIGVIGWTTALGKPGAIYLALGPAALLVLLAVPFYVAAWMAPKRDETSGK